MIGENFGKVFDCYATGEVEAIGKKPFAGGLIGVNIDWGMVMDSYATGTVTTTGNGSRSVAGGLIGASTSANAILGCRAEGNVSATGVEFVIAGGLVGYISDGKIIDSYATGTAAAVGNEGAAGGLIGWASQSEIRDCYATGDPTGEDKAGGLVGYISEGKIIDSYATGDATSTGNDAGGLVGYTARTQISGNYAIGNVSGADYVGGLAGVSSGGQISNSYATGDVVTTGNDAGGLVGNNTDSGNITACYATGTVEGIFHAGGLVGLNERGSSEIYVSYATGNVTATDTQYGAGGLVGKNNGIVRLCYATGNATGGAYAGGLVGFMTNNGKITACYATGMPTATETSGTQGGVVGEGRGIVAAGYFDSDVSSATQGIGDDATVTDLGKTTSDLQSLLDYTGIYMDWDIDKDGTADAGDFWDFGTSSEYPALMVDFDGDGDTTAYEFGGQGREVILALRGISPMMAQIGAAIKITGTGFSTDHMMDSVSFDGAATYVAASRFGGDMRPGDVFPPIDTLEVNVPSVAETGTLWAKVEDGTPAESVQEFEVLPPTIENIVPMMAQVGAVVKIAVTGFSTDPMEDSVLFQGSGYVAASAFTAYDATTNGDLDPSVDTLEVNVPSDAETGMIMVKVLNGTAATSTNSFTVEPPTIEDIVPMMAEVSTTIKIAGTGFSSTFTEDSVLFSGSEYVAASAFTAYDATTNGDLDPSVDTLEVSVPSDAETGVIMVKVLNGTAATSSQTFTVSESSGSMPEITDIDPESGVVGADVTISGQNFGATEADNEVTFLGAENDPSDDKMATISTASTTQLVVEVPEDAQTGKISVTVGSETVISSDIFTVLGEGALAITSINPSSGSMGADVTISGQNFGATPSDNEVTFLGEENDPSDDKMAVISTANTTEIVVMVPDDAKTGKISVTVDGETVILSRIVFTVTDTAAWFWFYA